jgi:hypothetical protein
VPLEIVYKPLDDIVPADMNPKRHDLATIQKSYTRFGYAEAITEDGRTGKLVSGHGRVEALAALKEAGAEPPGGITVVDDAWMVPVQVGWSSRNDAEAQAFLVAANRLTETGGWDDQSLADLLDIISKTPQGLDGVGYSQEELADLLALMEGPMSLDDLAEKYGEPGEDDFWPVLRFRVPPDVEQRYLALVQHIEGDDVVKFVSVLNRASRL